MKEIISVYVGQAGVQIGNSCWELYCLEHGIQPDGVKLTDAKSIGESDINSDEKLFIETKAGKYVPRALYIDSESSVIEEVRNGPYRKLFDPDFLVTGDEDAASNFAKGHYIIPREMSDPLLERLRKMIENCDSLQGFLVHHSVGGGTGSGLGCKVLQTMLVEYEKKQRVSFSIYPSPHISTAVVEPYNAIFSTNSLIEHSDLTVVLDNEAIYDICKKPLEIEGPGYLNLNRVIAQCISSITAPMRFEGALNTSIQELTANLVVYPNIHFALASHAPFIPVEKAYHTQPTVAQLTESAFDPGFMLAKCDPNRGKYIAASAVYRGDVVPKDVSTAINDIKEKRTIQLVDYVPTGFKVGITQKGPSFVAGGDMASVMRTVSLVANTTAIGELFTKLRHKVEMMYVKRVFVHWYLGEGMEEGEFTESAENVYALEKDLEEVGMESS